MRTRKLAVTAIIALTANVVHGQNATTSSAVAETTAGLCYYPLASGGQQAPDNVPCEPLESISMCCPAGWTCMSSHVCVVTDLSGETPGSNVTVGTSRRPTCTDPDWSSECGDYCLGLPPGDPGDLTACGNNVFACLANSNNQSANCSAGIDVFTLPTGTAITIIAVATGVSTLPASTSGTTTAMQTASSTTNSTPTPTPLPKKKSHVVAIGVGAGVGGAAIIAAAAVLLCCCLPKQKKNKNKQSGLSYQDTKILNAATHNYSVKAAPPQNVYSIPPAADHPAEHEPLPQQQRAGEFNSELYDDGHNNLTNTSLVGSRGGLSGRASLLGANGLRYDESDRGYDSGRFANIDV